MTNVRRLPGANPEQREYVRQLMLTRSPRSAAKLLGVSRETAIGIAAGLPVAPGTLALLREHMRSAPLAVSFVATPEARR